MPTQLPLEATDFFGDLLFPHVHKILLSDASQVNKIRYLFSNLLFISNSVRVNILHDISFIKAI